MELPRTNTPEFTVSELAQAVKRTVEDEFQYVRVRGEISGFRGQHSSGHAYFTLKDDQAAIDAVVWKTTWPRLRFKPEEGLEIIDGIRKSTVKKSKFTDPATGKVIETEGFPNPTKGQLEGIAAIENNIYKPAFDVGMRAIYSAQQGSFQGSVVSHLISLMKPFDGANTLGIARYGAIFTDLPWEDVSGHHKSHLFDQLVHAYRRRSYFHEPYKTPPFTMSGEELATLFHVPSAGVTAPSLPRISSSTSEAPSNLPT